MSNIGIACLISTSFLIGCSWWSENQKDVKSIVKTADDVAQTLCGMFYGDKMNINVQDAIRTFCDTREKFEPWIDQVLAGAKAGGDAKLKPKSSADSGFLQLGDPWVKPVASTDIPALSTSVSADGLPSQAPVQPVPSKPLANGKVTGKGETR